MSAIVFACVLVLSAHQSSAQTALPSGWTSRDIGATGGGSTSSNGTWTVSGSGANIWGASDAFQFAYRSTTGDFDISARLAAFDGPNEWSKAGLMVRESLNANARNAFVMFSEGTGSALQYRTATGGTTARVTGAGAAVPIYLRLVRQGTRFTAYSSATGTSWTTIGSATISMASAAYVGLAVTSRDPAATAEATFTNVALGASAEEPLGTWNSSDIGSPSVAGAFSASGGTYMVSGAGSDIWRDADQFRYAYQTTQGDVEIVARLSTFQAPDGWSKAGVMIRQSLAAGSQNASMLLTGQNGYAFQRRIAANGASYHTAGSSGAAPGWLRIVREGNLFSAYQSTNGSSWTLVGTDTISMTGTVYVGFAVTSHMPSTAATATFTNLTIRTPNSGTNQSPSVTLTAPSSGATYTAPATISFSASASDSDGSVSRVDFYRGSTLVSSDTTSPYTASWTGAPAGTYALTAVAVDNEGASTTSPAVSVTVNGSSNQPPSVSFVSPSQGATFTAGTQIRIEAAASDSDGTVSRVELYQGSTLLKSDSTSPYSVNWYSVPAGTHTLTATARDNSGLTRSATMTITVNAAGNQLPNVTITSPTSGATYTAPATVNIQATASDADGTISRVEFYRGTTLISTDTTSPYAASWTNAGAGTYALTARAYDNSGGQRTSTAVNVSIGSPTNQLPTVAISSPSSGASFTAPASIAIAASAADADGTIAGVDFYVGTQLIASDTSSPYTASWNNVAAGTYSLTAVARDNSGATRTSTAVAVTVSPATTQPTRVVFTASADHATNVNSYVVAIYRSTDPLTASPVATRDIGKPTPSGGDITVDISTLVNPLASGSYRVVVRAIGPGGTTASTPSATFTK
jgi:regulation of enolase protein 1 (concanavalin A-like superfamily)